MTTHHDRPSPRPRSTTPEPKSVIGRFFRRIPPTLYFGAAAAVLLALIPVSVWFTTQAQQADDRADSSERMSSAVIQAAAPAVATVNELCARGDSQAIELQAQGKCDQAAEARKIITETPPPPPTATGLSVSQVRDILDERLSRLPKPITVDQVTTIAADIYAKNKPENGLNATPEMVATVVTSYCSNGACVGPAGKDQPPLTEAQILAQVTTYCDAHSDCAGPPGRQGVAGVSFARQYFARDEEDRCVSYVESYNPATDSTSTSSSPAGDASCPEAPGSPTPPPTPTR